LIAPGAFICSSFVVVAMLLSIVVMLVMLWLVNSNVSKKLVEPENNLSHGILELHDLDRI
jgi:hypothetical protein